MERIRSVKEAQRPIEDLVTSRIASAIGQLGVSEIFDEQQAESKNALLPTTMVTEANTQANRLGIKIQPISSKNCRCPYKMNNPFMKECEQNVRESPINIVLKEKNKPSAIRAKSDREAMQIRVEAEQKGIRNYCNS